MRSGSWPTPMALTLRYCCKRARVKGRPLPSLRGGEVPLPSGKPLGEVLPALLHGAEGATDAARAVLFAHTAGARLVCLARPDHQHEFLCVLEVAPLAVLSYLKVFAARGSFFSS